MITLRDTILVTVALAAAGCAHVPASSVESADVLAAFDAARRQIEQVRGPIEAIWLSESVDSRVKSLLVRERAAVAGMQPAGQVVALPERHFLIDSFSLNSTDGRISGVVGPRSSPVTMAACGTGLSLALSRHERAWRAQIVGGTVC